MPRVEADNACVGVDGFIEAIGTREGQPTIKMCIHKDRIDTQRAVIRVDSVSKSVKLRKGVSTRPVN
jgi:hypothetical protein